MLTIEDPDIERTVARAARQVGESEEDFVRKAVAERASRLDELSVQERIARWNAKMDEFWAGLPPEARRPMTKEEREEILGYGPDGYSEH